MPAQSHPTPPPCNPYQEGPPRKAYENFPTTGDVGFDVIAEAWLAGGGRPEQCESAIIIASGECAPSQSEPTVMGCNIDQSGQTSGIWQVDSAKTAIPPGSPMLDLYKTNPAVNAWVVTPLLNKTFAVGQKYDLGCYTGSGRTAPLTLAAAIEQGGAIGEITAEQAMCEQAGLECCNFIGDFCHVQQGYSQNNGCCLFAGGKNRGKDWLPFPYFYYAKMIELAKGEKINDPQVQEQVNPAEAWPDYEARAKAIAKHFCDGARAKAQ